MKRILMYYLTVILGPGGPYSVRYKGVYRKRQNKGSKKIMEIFTE